MNTGKNRGRILDGGMVRGEERAKKRRRRARWEFNPRFLQPCWAVSLEAAQLRPCSGGPRKILLDRRAMWRRDNFVSRGHRGFRIWGKHAEHFRRARHLLTSGLSKELPPRGLRSED